MTPGESPLYRTAKRIVDQIEAAHIVGHELGHTEEARQILRQAARSAQCLPDLASAEDQSAAIEIARLMRLARSGGAGPLRTAARLAARLMLQIEQRAERAA